MNGVRALWLGLGFALLAASGAALAHDWYDYACCSDHDCHPVAVEDVQDLGHGRWRHDGMIFGPDNVKPSRDDHFHVCVGQLTTGERVPLCIYILQGM